MAEKTKRDLVPGFAKAVRRARQSKRLTLKALGLKTGTSGSSVAKIEGEGRAPSLRVALLLAKVLGISLDGFKGAV